MDGNGERPLHRHRTWRKEEREKDKEMRKINWYRRGKRAEDTYNFPIFCPATPRGKLAKSWRRVAEEIKKESKGRVRPKIIEQGGISLKSKIIKHSPKRTTSCDKKDCPVCLSGKGSNMNCHTVTPGGAGYVISCITCRDKGIDCKYHGETSRTLYTRLREHTKALEEGQSENPLRRHAQNSHGSENVKYEFAPYRFFSDPLTRQIDEGIRINMGLVGPTTIMNSKSEFRQGVVPRIETVVGIN